MHDIDLENIPEDPTELITKNKTFLSDLKKHGLDGKQIRKILRNYHGLDLYSCGFPSERKKGWIKTEDLPEHTAYSVWISQEPGTFTPFNVTDKEFHENVHYALRRIAVLLKDPVISGETKRVVIKEKDRLLKIKDEWSYKLRPERLLHPGEKDATLKARFITQMTGFQVVSLYNYIKPITKKINEEMLHTQGARGHKNYRDKEIFLFICEIFNSTDSLKPYTEERIKNLYNNNYKYSNELK